MERTAVPTIVCTPCLRADQTVDAVKYCIECNENFCRSCLRKHIKELSTGSRQHRLLNRDEAPDWLSGRSAGGSSNCSMHPDNQLDSYCDDHDVVCCGACVVTEHSSCVNVTDLIPLPGDVEPKSDSDALVADLKHMVDALRALQHERRKDQSKLRRSTAESLTMVRDFRQRINVMFDELEKQAIEDIDTECINEDDVIERDIRESENSIVLIEMVMKQISDTKEDDDKQQIESSIIVVNGKRLLRDTKQMYKKLQDKNGFQRLIFSLNQNIEKYVSALKSIGSCNKGAADNVKSGVVPVEMYINTKDDQLTCDIQGAVQTESGTFLLLDADNKSIKLLNESYNVVKTYGLAKHQSEYTTCIYEPFAMCCTSEHQIAVSMIRDKVVKIFKVGEEWEKLEETDEIVVGEYCRGVAYSSTTEELYVACGGGAYTGEGLGHVRVYNLKGELLRSYKHTSDGKAIFQRPMHLAMSRDCYKIFIADSIKGVITLDAEGEVLSTFTAPELEEARAICVDVNDHVIVAGYVSNNILRIHDDIKRYDVLLPESSIVTNVQALAYDAIASTCVVASNCSNRIHVFDI